MGAFYYGRMWVSVTPEALWIELVSRGQFMGLEWYLFYYYNTYIFFSSTTVAFLRLVSELSCYYLK